MQLLYRHDSCSLDALGRGVGFVGSDVGCDGVVGVF